MTAIPIIDIATLLDVPSSPIDGAESATIHERHRDVVSQVHAASLNKGIFILTGHGIPRKVQLDALEQSSRFFELPMAEKLKLAEDKSFGRSHRGYQLFGGEAYENGKLPDLKEGFQVGVHKDVGHPDCVARRMLCGPNVYPQSMEPAFSSAMQDHFTVVSRLAFRLVEILAECLQVDYQTYLAPLLQDPLQALRLLHYPPTPGTADAEKQLGVGAHTDFGLVTLLLTDGVAGLQVFDAGEEGGDGKWIGVECRPEDYIVNLGDIFTKLTAGRYKSPLHRVLNEGKRHRYSIPFFLDGNLSAVVDSFVDGHCVEASGMTVEEHMTERFRTTRERAKEEMKRVGSRISVVA